LHQTEDWNRIWYINHILSLYLRTKRTQNQHIF